MRSWSPPCSPRPLSQPTPPPATYSDVAGAHFAAEAIAELQRRGVLTGTDCAAGAFCPAEAILRQTLAVWIVRVLDPAFDPAAADHADRFTDVAADHRWAAQIERLAQLGVTSGCGDGTRYCPDQPVTRAQMAVFLSRALSLPEAPPTGPDDAAEMALAPTRQHSGTGGPHTGFDDVAASHFAASAINSLRESKITAGCGDGAIYCPDQPTTRAQMAVFIVRGLQQQAAQTAPPPENDGTPDTAPQPAQRSVIDPAPQEPDPPTPPDKKIDPEPQEPDPDGRHCDAVACSWFRELTEEEWEAEHDQPPENQPPENQPPS